MQCTFLKDKYISFVEIRFTGVSLRNKTLRVNDILLKFDNKDIGQYLKASHASSLLNIGTNKPRGLYFSKALFEGLSFGGAYIRRGL